MKTPKQIVNIVLTELRAKKLLRESPEGEMNNFINDLQSCVSELSSLKEQIEGLITSNVDEEEIQTLTLVKSKIDYISTTINNVVTKTTGNNTVQPIAPVSAHQLPRLPGGIEEDTSNGSVNMSVDNIVKKPDVVKKLESGNLTINAIGDDGKPLTEEATSEVTPTVKHTTNGSIISNPPKWLYDEVLANKGRVMPPNVKLELAKILGNPKVKIFSVQALSDGSIMC